LAHTLSARGRAHPEIFPTAALKTSADCYYL